MFAARQALLNATSSEEEYKMALEQLIGMGKGGNLDEGYLMSLYFPESYPPARIPTNFGLPSSLVTQRFSFYVNTGSGDGMIAMLPQDLTGYACFKGQTGQLILSGSTYNDSTSTLAADFNYPWTGKAQNLINCLLIQESSCSFVPESFAHARVVGASMRVSYIGTHDSESGFMAGAHIYDKRPCELSEDAIEDGYYVTRCRPIDGMRLVYQPRDDRDFEYIPLDYKWTHGTPDTYKERFGVQGAYKYENCLPLSPDDIMSGGYQFNDDLSENLRVNSSVWKLTNPTTTFGAQYNASSAGWQPMPGIGQKADQYALQQTWGAGPRFGMSPTPQILACYFKGLPPNQTYLRVDVVRHLECVPRNALRDIISVDRPVPNEESIKAASQAGPVMPSLHSSIIDVRDHSAPILQHHLMASQTSTGLIQRIKNGVRTVVQDPRMKAFASGLGKTVFTGAADMLFGPEATIPAELLWDTMTKRKKTALNEGYGNPYDGLPSVKKTFALEYE